VAGREEEEEVEVHAPPRDTQRAPWSFTSRSSLDTEVPATRDPARRHAAFARRLLA